MVFDDPDLVREFVTESTEHLANVESQILAIESGGQDVDIEVVNVVFRAVHSIKGAAGFMGFSSIQSLSHSLENVLNLLRGGSLSVSKDVTEALLDAADQLSMMFEDIESSNDIDVEKHARRLDLIATLENEPKDNGSQGTGQETEVSTAHKDRPAEPAVSEDEQASPPISSSSNQEACKTPANTAANIRVSVEVLDNLMNLAGELVLGRNQLMQSVQSGNKQGLESVSLHVDQITSELQEAIMKTRMQPIGHVFNRFTRIVRDLSKQLGKKCEVKIEGRDVEVDKTIIEAIGDPLTHLVRNSIDHGIESPDERARSGKSEVGTLLLKAYHQSGKVRIEILDDGKGVCANRVRSKAIENGVISVEDGAALTDSEAVRLIFQPGFSTAEQVSDISGRGVGMDVVKSNIEKLGGTVDIETDVGASTRIVVTLPLTLAIIPCMIIESQSEKFAIPQVNVAELVRIRGDEFKKRIRHVSSKPVLELRGNLLPLMSLRESLGQSHSWDRSELAALNIVVVESGPLRYGLVVDTLFDCEEIVVKPLGRHLKDCQYLSGATILGDGRVALIIDVVGIAKGIGLTSTEVSNANSRPETAAGSIPTLLFNYHPDELFGIVMESVVRIERAMEHEIKVIGAQEVFTHRAGVIPLISLDKFLETKPRVPQGRTYIVILESAGREIGIIAPELVDIRNLSGDYDTDTFCEQGVAGSQNLSIGTARLLDTADLIRIARPEWFENPESNVSTAGFGSEAGSPRHTVLLAEDSPFFRYKVKGYLEKSGLEVVDFADGAEAWDALSNERVHPSLILTDIEMPVMNGLEFVRRIRSDERLCEIPVIALTSLASEEDFQRGYDAGVTEYQVKMDREELIKAVVRLVRDVNTKNILPQLDMESQCLSN